MALNKKTLERLERLAAQSKKSSDQAPIKPPGVGTHEAQIPLWPEPLRAVPNPVLRSALFGVVKRGKREYHSEKIINSTAESELKYKGERLDQNDLDVWETLLHIARTQGLEGECRFNAYQFLKKLGKTDTGKNRKTLHSQLLRLTANALQIKTNGFTYFGSLVDSAVREDETGEYIVTFNPNIKRLFGVSQSTLVPWEQRKALAQKSLAQWLHGYYCSHDHPYKVKMKTIRSLSGFGESRNFPSKLKAALKDLGSATGWECAVVDGLVVVTKN